MKTFIVGTWKLNFNVGEASIYLHKLQKKLPNYRDVEVVVAPSTIALQPLSLQIDRHKMKLAAQNAFYRDYGAFTGETSFSQLRGVVDYCIIGHSERRYIFGEDDKMVAKKMEAAVRNKITPILCIGETESERSFGETADVIRDQLLGGLRDVSEEDIDKVLIAYEPVKTPVLSLSDTDIRSTLVFIDAVFMYDSTSAFLSSVAILSASSCSGASTINVAP